MSYGKPEVRSPSAQLVSLEAIFSKSQVFFAQFNTHLATIERLLDFTSEMGDVDETLAFSFRVPDPSERPKSAGRKRKCEIGSEKMDHLSNGNIRSESGSPAPQSGVFKESMVFTSFKNVDVSLVLSDARATHGEPLRSNSQEKKPVEVPLDRSPVSELSQAAENMKKMMELGKRHTATIKSILEEHSANFENGEKSKLLEKLARKKTKIASQKTLISQLQQQVSSLRSVKTPLANSLQLSGVKETKDQAGGPYVINLAPQTRSESPGPCPNCPRLLKSLSQSTFKSENLSEQLHELSGKVLLLENSVMELKEEYTLLQQSIIRQLPPKPSDEIDVDGQTDRHSFTSFPEKSSLDAQPRSINLARTIPDKIRSLFASTTKNAGSLSNLKELEATQPLNQSMGNIPKPVIPPPLARPQAQPQPQLQHQNLPQPQTQSHPSESLQRKFEEDNSIKPSLKATDPPKEPEPKEFSEQNESSFTIVQYNSNDQEAEIDAQSMIRGYSNRDLTEKTDTSNLQILNYLFEHAEQGSKRPTNEADD